MGIAPDASFTMMSSTHFAKSGRLFSAPNCSNFLDQQLFILPSGNGLNFGEAYIPHLLDKLYIVKALTGPSNSNIGEFSQKDNVVWSLSSGPVLVNSRNIRE